MKFRLAEERSPILRNPTNKIKLTRVKVGLQTVYRVIRHLVNIHSIRAGNIVTQALDQVKVHKVLCHPVIRSCAYTLSDQGRCYCYTSPESSVGAGSDWAVCRALAQSLGEEDAKRGYGQDSGHRSEEFVPEC